MSSIVFNEETRSFSVVESQNEYADSNVAIGKIANHIKSNKRAYIDAATAVGGGTIGGVIARQKAKKAAASKGMQKGTAEYKKFINKSTAKGTAVGAGAGIGAAEGAQLGKKVLSRAPHIAVYDKEGNIVYKKGKVKGIRAAAKEQFVNPIDKLTLKRAKAIEDK